MKGDKEMAEQQKKAKDPVVLFATAAVRSWVTAKKQLAWRDYAAEVPVDRAIAVRMTGSSSGAFVSINRYGLLRGCIGTIEPVRPTLSEEIVSNAASSCSRDPRFPPVLEEELDTLSIKVDILSPPMAYEGLEDWDVRRYGVIVSGAGGRRGVLLPDLDGIYTAADQMDIASQKAGLQRAEINRVWLFEVERHE